MGNSVSIVGTNSDSVEILNVGNGISQSTITLNGSYGAEFIQNLGAGNYPPYPQIEFERAYGVGVTGLKIVVSRDTNTGITDVEIVGSHGGVGFTMTCSLDPDFKVLEASGFAGLQLIGGTKYKVFGVPIGAEGVIRFGLEIDDQGLNLNASGDASIGFVFGEVEIDTETNIQIIDFGDFCFAAGTFITLADGSTKLIEDIILGDMVMSFDSEGNLVPAPVAQLLSNVTDTWLKLSNGTVVTPGHRYLRPDGSFMEIKDIIAGDGQIVAEDGSVMTVTAEVICYSAETAHMFETAEKLAYATHGATALAPEMQTGWKTYNFTVDGTHTYIAVNEKMRFAA